MLKIKRFHMRSISLEKQSYPILPNRCLLQHFIIVVTFPLSRSKVQYWSIEERIVRLLASRRALRLQRAFWSGKKWFSSTSSTTLFGSASKKQEQKDPTMALPWRTVAFKSTLFKFQIQHTIKKHEKSNPQCYVYDIPKIELV